MTSPGSLNELGSVSEPLLVTHAAGTYPVHVGHGLLSQLNTLVQHHLSGRRIAVISDAAVAHLLQNVEEIAATLVVPSGEASKTRAEWERLTDLLHENRCGRDSGIIALGGGVVGDLAGFVAATYERGIPWIHVPTTLLAMLDAAVGGKTGVDTPYGKNLVGAFHQPEAVLMDPALLSTLPERTFRAGLAEAVKHGVIEDRGYFDWIGRHAGAIARQDPAILTHLIRRSVEIKALVVAEDEREAGRRAVLNAGHTIAHAVEALSAYQIPHGEAVAMGLVTECRLAERVGVAEPGTTQGVSELIGALCLPVNIPNELERHLLVQAMLTDKKNRRGKIRCALPSAIGTMSHIDGDWTTAVTEEDILNSL